MHICTNSQPSKMFMEIDSPEESRKPGKRNIKLEKLKPITNIKAHYKYVVF